MGCICAKQADMIPQHQQPHSPAVANNAAWSPTRAPHVQGAGTMATHRPGAATPQPLVRPSKSGAREASRSDSGDDEIGADFGGHIHMRSSTASGSGVNLNGSQGGGQGQQQTNLGGSTSGAGSTSFPHLVAIQHLRNQQQAETAARAAAETPKQLSKSSIQNKKMALLGGVMSTPSAEMLRTATPQSSGDDRTADTNPPSVLPTLFTVSGGGSLSQASIPPISPRRHKDKKEKQEKQEKREKREKRREKRSKKHRSVGGGSITESMHCDPSHGAGGDGGLIQRRNSSLAGSMSSMHSSSCGSAAFVDMSTSGCSQPDHSSSAAMVTHNTRRYTNLDLGH